MQNVDKDLTEKILNIINSPEFKNISPLKVNGIPSFGNKKIIDVSKSFQWHGNYEKAALNIEKLSGSREIIAPHKKKTEKDGTITLNREELEAIGLSLFPLTALGILNGGSATSYMDTLKNSTLNKPLFDSSKKLFYSLSEKYKNLPKGLIPAYINQDSSEGYSFCQLKMRSILLKTKQYINSFGKINFGNQLFQMTSCNNNSVIEKGFKSFAESPILRNLIEETGSDPTTPLTGIQPLITAFTHSSYSEKRQVFASAWGKEGQILPLPGGHGQNFFVLKEIYKKLYNEGKRFVYLGNVDNLGFNIDLAEVAFLALSGSQAAFDFAFKTPVDVKGGILVYDDKERLNCGEIGLAISKNYVNQAEKKGKPILFNCATGLINLEYLVKSIDQIIENLPVRLSDQEKDIGKYSQAEQTTWEIIGLLDDIIIFGVDKYKRFLASKLLMENLLISRTEHINSYFIENPSDPMNEISKEMNKGLHYILEKEMKLSNFGGKWR